MNFWHTYDQNSYMFKRINPRKWSQIMSMTLQDGRLISRDHLFLPNISFGEHLALTVASGVELVVELVVGPTQEGSDGAGLEKEYLVLERKYISQAQEKKGYDFTHVFDGELHVSGATEPLLQLFSKLRQSDREVVAQTELRGRGRV